MKCKESLGEDLQQWVEKNGIRRWTTIQYIIHRNQKDHTDKACE